MSLQHLTKDRAGGDMGNTGNFLDAMGERLSIARQNVGTAGLGLCERVDPTPGKLTQRQVV